MKRSNYQPKRGAAKPASKLSQQVAANRRKTYENTQLAWDSVVKDELITAVNGSVALSATEYPINPGMSTTFPLGSAEAAKWTEWKCEYVEFYYRRTVSEYATQGTTGRVVLACDYSALNGAPTTLQQAEALHCAFGMPCDEEIRLRLDPRIVNKADPKYIRTTEPSGHSDIRLFDGGNFWFVVSGCQNGTEIGELRVRYHFKVRLPNLLNTGAISNTTFSQWNLAANTAALSADATLDISEALVVASGTPPTNASGVITLGTAGVYKVQIEVGYSTTGGIDNTARMVLWVDGAETSPPIYLPMHTYATNYHSAGCFSGLVISSGTTTVAARFDYGGTSAFTFQADCCRISIEQL
jgi:hypothetical protein